MKHGAFKDMLSLIKNEKPARVVIMQDGLIFSRIYVHGQMAPFPFEPKTYMYDHYTGVKGAGKDAVPSQGTSLRIPRAASQDPNNYRIITFKELGYVDMVDENAKRAFSNTLAKMLGNYRSFPHEHQHEEERWSYQGGGPATALKDRGSDSYTIYSGGSGSISTNIINVIDGYTYFLTREDLIPQQAPAQIKEDKPKLKKW